MLVTGTHGLGPDTTVTVGRGKSIHWGSRGGTMCGAAHRNGFSTTPVKVHAETATCKRCIKLMVLQANLDHAAALAQLELDAAHLEALNEDAQRTWDAERAEDLAAPSVNFPAAVALDTWLTAGLVLVGPATDSLYVFQSWQGGTAVLLHADTGEAECVAQADIVNWRYLPGVELDDVCAVELRKGDVVRFTDDTRFYAVASVKHHQGTPLYSFAVEASVVEFVRKAPDLVKRVDLPRR